MGLVLRAEKLLNNTQEAKLQLGGLLGCRLMLGGTRTALGGRELPAQCCSSQIWLPKCPPGME